MGLCKTVYESSMQSKKIRKLSVHLSEAVDDANENIIVITQRCAGQDDNVVTMTTTDLKNIHEALIGISIGKMTGDSMRFSAEKDKLFLNAAGVSDQIKGLAVEGGNYSSVIRICALITYLELKERGFEC